MFCRIVLKTSGKPIVFLYFSSSCLNLCVLTQRVSFLVILIKTDTDIVENVTLSFRGYEWTLILICLLKISSSVTHVLLVCVCVCVFLSVCYEWHNSLLPWRTVLCLPVIQSLWWPIRAGGEMKDRPHRDIFHYTDCDVWWMFTTDQTTLISCNMCLFTLSVYVLYWCFTFSILVLSLNEVWVLF